MSVISARRGKILVPLSFIVGLPRAFRFISAPANLPIVAFCQPAQQRELTKPKFHRLRRSSAPAHARRNIAPNVARACDLRTGADLDVADHSNLTAENHIIVELGAPGNTRLCDDDAMPADHDV